MGWNGSGQKGATPAQPKKVTQKKPSPIRGLVAGAVVVALAGAAYFAFFSGSEKPQKAESDKKPGRIKEVTPAPTPKAAVERKEVEKPAPKAGKEPDTNIVWVSKMRYIKKMANGDSVMVFVDNPDEKKFLDRVSKEIWRVFGNLCGAADSAMGCVLSPVTTTEDLDALPSKYICPEPMNTIRSHLKHSGVKPYRKATYKEACREGWAHQPTNEFQKAIWDKVHEAPTKPLVIAPEKTKQK